MPHRQWYYQQNEQRVGPIPKDQFAELFRTGQLPPETMVWAEGLKDWAPAFKVKGLLPEPIHNPIDDYLTPMPTYEQEASNTEKSVAIFQENPSALSRLAAAILDTVVLTMIIFSLFRVATAVVGTEDPDRFIWTVNILSTIAGWLYFALLESSQVQGSIGKILLGFAVTDLGGKRISFLQATARHFAKILSVVTLGIGYAMCLWTEDRQCLHDKIAGCIMYKRR